MDLFHRIDDCEAIVRLKGGVFKQTEVYRRVDRIYVKAAGGFVRVCAKFNDVWGTSNPGISVVDMSKHVRGLSTPGNAEPRWTGSSRA